MVSKPTFVVCALVSCLPLSAQDTPGTPKPSGPPKDTEIVTTASGLKYSILQKGDGERAPKMGERVTVHYTGWLEDGTKFDSSRDNGKPFAFVLGVGQVIKGWDEGVALMTKGTRCKLTIPYDLAYGEDGRPPRIPAKATLIFDVELLSFEAMPEFKAGVKDKQKKTESGLVYELLKEGTGDKLKAEQSFELRYAFWNSEGKLLEATEQNDATIKGLVESMNYKFLQEAPLLMRVGDRMRFEVPPALLFGATERGPDLPANSVTIWELELMSARTPPKLPDFVMPKAEELKTTASGLQYMVVKEGEGAKPTASSQVTVHYAGWLPDGKLFDASYNRGETATFPLGNVIKGWTEGLQLMKVGSIYKFVIPAKLAYGAGGQGPIPPNATLVFHVELIEVRG